MESTFGRHGGVGDAQEVVYRVAIATRNATPGELCIAGSGRLLVDAGRTLSCLVKVVTGRAVGIQRVSCGGWWSETWPA